MGDPRFSNGQLQREPYRVNTYGENSNAVAKDDLAKGGRKVKCVGCGLKVYTSLVGYQEIHTYHEKKSPHCQYTTFRPPLQSRTKKFFYHSVKFEKERLESFIDWPVERVNPSDLAREGFLYQRKNDNCFCVFCEGVLTGWKKGYVPRRVHRNHFPNCPFIKGKAVGNIPIAYSSIISSFTHSPEPFPSRSLKMGVCGIGRPMPGSYPECDTSKKTDLMLARMGLPKHSGPKRKEFISQTVREESFKNWPEMVKQRPKELAEAGFFFFGISDYVICFCCGNGLRNWEKDAIPWVEHARWYPECNFVHITKGHNFIDKVRRETSPYLHSQKVRKANSAVKNRITEGELDHLMELDIMKATMNMGFPPHNIRAALRRKLEQTGLPFFEMENCIEALLMYMEEETRLTLHANNNVEREATEQQGAKMETLPASRRQGETFTNTVSPTASTPSSSSSSLSSPAGPSSRPEPMEVESSPVSFTDEIPSQNDQVIGIAERAFNAGPTLSSSTPNPFPGTPLITSVTSTPTNPPTDFHTPASTVAAIATASASTSTRFSPSQPQDEKMRQDEKQFPPTHKLTSSGKPQSSQELAAELEKMQESRMCKVCMDAEIDMVFLPCSHMVTCSSCTLPLTQCPICRNDIKYTIKAILS